MTDELNIEKFNPTVAELTALAESTKDIVAIDLTDKAQIERVKTARLTLRNAQIRVEKAGKELRAGAVKFQKDVIAKERELTDIVESELQRLETIEEEAKQLAIKTRRLEELPERKEILRDIIGAQDIDSLDEHLLTLDTVQFETYCTELKNEKIRLEQEEKDRIQAEKQRELDEREAKVHEAERAAEEEKRAQEREAKAREDERVRLQREEDERKGREAKEKEEAEQREREAKEKLEKAKKFKEFRESCGWTPETAGDFKEETFAGQVTLWKKVGVFKIK